MAPYRGRGGRGGRHNGSQNSGRLARSGIRTKNGYKKFDSQRLRERDASPDEIPAEAPEAEDSEHSESLDESDIGGDDTQAPEKSYAVLLQSFKQNVESGEPRSKRRKLDSAQDFAVQAPGHKGRDEDLTGEESVEPTDGLPNDLPSDDGEDGDEDEDDESDTLDNETEDTSDLSHDPYETRFVSIDNADLARQIKSVKANEWRVEKQNLGKPGMLTLSGPASATNSSTLRKPYSADPSELALKKRLEDSVSTGFKLVGDLDTALAPYIFEYVDLLVGCRNLRNAKNLRRMACLHATNHVLKIRDKVLKNNERIRLAGENGNVEARDQGFVRPKVLILLETRQMAASYADCFIKFFRPDQQENRKRFDEAFRATTLERDTMPDDFRELFSGNNDNNFVTALKFTRKTIKFYSGFYNSDVILASPLGLRRIIENEDKKKRDHDFLSSIEMVIVDQADAMQQQNWENVEVVFQHLNLDLKEAHGCDFSRVRPYYLDGNARYLRQTIIFGAYITPEMNRLYNNNLTNIAGKAKLVPKYSGAIADTSGLGIKQTFSRFNSRSPADDPDARFKFFTSAILPNLLRHPRPADGATGILIFIPSYYDFLRVRNYFATSTQTENITFGAIHDYSDVSEQRRARSHFLSGRFSFLLYTQRAHHFYRLKIRGVKRVALYGLPDNPIFYQEMVEGFLGTSINDGNVDVVETSVRSAFSKWDGLRLERVAGSERIRTMLSGTGDTFDFI